MRPLQDCPWHSRFQSRDSLNTPLTYANITVCSNVSIFLHSILNFRGLLTIHITYMHAFYVPLPNYINVTADGYKLLTFFISVLAKLCSSISVSYRRTEFQQDWQHIQCNINARSCNHCCSEKAIIISYSECVSVLLIIHHAKRMRHIILLSVAVWLYKFFQYYLTKGMIFRKKVSNIKCVFWFSLQLRQKMTHSKDNSAIYYHKCT